MAAWDDPDVDLLYEVNGLAEAAPTWADRTMQYVGEYGIVAGLVVLGLLAWWRVVRRKETRPEAVSGFAGLLWTPLAAAIALLANIPIRDLVERPRPFVEHEGLEVLVGGKSDYSFVSDHATLAMALAVGIFMVHRRYGALGIVLAVLAGASRVYMGVHYPTDVIGGLALGAAVTLLLAPVAIWALTPPARMLADSPRTGALVWAGREPAPRDEPGTEPRAESEPESNAAAVADAADMADAAATADAAPEADAVPEAEADAVPEADADEVPEADAAPAETPDGPGGSRGERDLAA